MISEVSDKMLQTSKVLANEITIGKQGIEEISRASTTIEESASQRPVVEEMAQSTMRVNDKIIESNLIKCRKIFLCQWNYLLSLKKY